MKGRANPFRETPDARTLIRSEEHTSELQSIMLYPYCNTLPRHDALPISGLVGRHAAALQQLDLARILVHEDDIMAEIRETRAGYQADIARAGHNDPHHYSPSSNGFRPTANRS